MAKKSRSLKRAHSRKMKHTRKHKVHRKHTQHRRRTARRVGRKHGGADMLDGAPVFYHLSGSWPSRMSLGQGADYFKYHEGQHGGAALEMGPFPGAVLSPGLPADLRGPAHIGGIDKAIADVRGLCDPPTCAGTQGPVTTGGNRNKRNSRRNRKNGGGNTKRNRKNGGDRRNRRNAEEVAAGVATEAAANATNAAVVANAAAAAAQQAAVVANVAATAPVAPASAPSAVGGRNRRNRRRNGGALGYAPFPSSGMLLSSEKQYAEAGLNPEWKTDVAFEDAKIRLTQ
jgi:hypothetical protein